MKRLIAGMILVVIIIAGCSSRVVTDPLPYNEKNWENMVKSAELTTVKVYLVTDNQEVTSWFNREVKTILSNKYNIQLAVVTGPLEEVREPLVTAKDDPTILGDIDLIILDDEAYLTLKRDQVLFTDYTMQIPNYALFVGKKNDEIERIYGHETQEDLAIIARDTFMTFYNEDMIEDEDYLERLEEEVISMDEDFLEVFRGEFTFLAPDQPLGLAFVSAYVYKTLTDKDVLMDDQISLEAARAHILPALRMLKEDSKDFYLPLPESQEEMDKLFLGEKIFTSMGLYHHYATDMEDEDLYPDGTRPLLLSQGYQGERWVSVIPDNSANKTGAMVVINELLSIDLQADLSNPKVVGLLPGLDLSLLSEDEMKSFTRITTKRTAPAVDQIMPLWAPRFPRVVEGYIQVLWQEVFSE